MRKVLLTIAAAAAIVSAGSLLPNSAQALPFGSASGIRAALEEISLAEQAYHRVCRRWCGYYGCRVRCSYPRHYRYRYYRRYY